ncbi:SDR family NAD(P)-dependent oxidoreductase [Phenylobacterium montanum]|uniref:D-xylose 1-dehydrogenase n=1 Tax=Phenylobacterium montanum TaxID=2823693 RepID=A0A975IWS4_9CAUL|nr:SDR family oxidoreductase [Caulobacter sp. S6]QUD90377.1 SDR family oxidoreductase [Caulobacter sp. S6]
MRPAIVTGAARGIGRACARRLAEEGAQVLVVDQDREAGAAAVADLGSAGFEAALFAADLSRPEAADEVVEACVSAFGGVEILINNAGIAPRADFFEVSAADFDRVMAINLRAPFLLTQAAARRMREQGRGGAVVNISSINAVLNGPQSLSYCVSKGGLNQLTRNCAIALAPWNIRVNAVGPGTIVTEMAASFGLTGEGARAPLERTPLGRLGLPEEIASVAAFLASHGAAFVTGQTVYADGGRLGLNYSLPVSEPVGRS